jgi:hypothetical protein
VVASTRAVAVASARVVAAAEALELAWVVARAVARQGWRQWRRCQLGRR